MTTTKIMVNKIIMMNKLCMPVQSLKDSADIVENMCYDSQSNYKDKLKQSPQQSTNWITVV
jgi:hypothetical protein